jgi:hypothetical protein
MAVPGPGLTLLGRSYCHLCEAMLAAVHQAFPGEKVTEIDVDSDAGLEARYGELVPVLMLDGIEVCHYHLDGAALSERLAVRAAENPANASPEC